MFHNFSMVFLHWLIFLWKGAFLFGAKDLFRLFGVLFTRINTSFKLKKVANVFCCLIPMNIKCIGGHCDIILQVGVFPMGKGDVSPQEMVRIRF